MTTKLSHRRITPALFRVEVLLTLAITSAQVSPCRAFSQTALPQTAASQSPTPTLKTTVRRVDVDVVVTDADGAPVRGFTQDDFKVEEDKITQSVRSLDVHTVTTEVPLLAAPNLALPPNTFLNLQTNQVSGTPTVLLYDALNTSLLEQNYARQEMLRFIKTRRTGTQIAIFVLGQKLRLLQGFTQDTDLLSAALTSTKGGTHALALQSSSNELASTPGAMEGDPAFDQILRDFANMDKLDLAQTATWRLEVTINALTEIGRFLASVSGRKNLVWFSSAFPASIFRNGDPQDFHYNSIQLAAMKQARDLISLSHTAVYPVDVGGVRSRTTFDASKNASFGFNGTTLQHAQNRPMIQENGAQIGMDLIAEATGGHAFYGTNDLEEAVNSAISDGSTYYSLTYAPTNPNLDGSLRHIKVTLKKSGYGLAYRKTYYADDLNAVIKATASVPESPLTPALERGTPLEHELIVEAHLDETGTPVAATPAQIQVLSQYEAMQTKDQPKKSPEQTTPVMMQQYVISYGLIARQLEMPVNDAGIRQASLEFGFVAYDEDGRKLNGTDTHIDDTIPEPRYEKLMSDGYHVAQTISVPMTATIIRLAVRDVRGNRTGSLEVRLPLAKVAETKTPGALIK